MGRRQAARIQARKTAKLYTSAEIAQNGSVLPASPGGRDLFKRRLPLLARLGAKRG